MQLLLMLLLVVLPSHMACSGPTEGGNEWSDGGWGAAGRDPVGAEQSAGEVDPRGPTWGESDPVGRSGESRDPRPTLEGTLPRVGTGETELCLSTSGSSDRSGCVSTTTLTRPAVLLLPIAFPVEETGAATWLELEVGDDLHCYYRRSGSEIYTYDHRKQVPYLDRCRSRDERKSGVPSLVLMEHAGTVLHLSGGGDGDSITFEITVIYRNETYVDGGDE